LESISRTLVPEKKTSESLLYGQVLVVAIPSQLKQKILLSWSKDSSGSKFYDRR
jgi:hypothetical protein